MSYEQPISDQHLLRERPETRNRWFFLVNILLFILTFFTTTVSGVEWVNKDPFELHNFEFGLQYALAILFVLGCHEFGHYFAARYHNVETTLPFFIPWPSIPGFFILNFGTLGAVIRTRSIVPSKKAMFDIGVAGPIAGFVACIIVLTLGFLHLPSKEYLLGIHPDFDFLINDVRTPGGLSLTFGSTLFFDFMRNILTTPVREFIPPMTEIYHYPFLCVGWFGLFVTAMNLIPVGQTDGGHVIYSMFGEKHRPIARYAWIGLLVLGLPSVVDAFLRTALEYFKKEPFEQIIPFAQYSWSGWLLWAGILYYVIKLYHPPVPDETPLDTGRTMVGWVTLIIFVICFCFLPFSVSMR
jgi:membrane-associated protease RseP (regulator of RpoE activity)